jgi:hypothetical protein
MRKLFKLDNENLSMLVEELLGYIDSVKIEGILSITNDYKRYVSIFSLVIDTLLLRRMDILICILKRQMEYGLTANQIGSLRILTTFLKDCQRRDYF